MKRETIVLGGGIAGAAAAILLARAGQQVTLYEQHRTAKHKVCGEFLSQEAVMYLKRLGIDPLAMGGEAISQLRFAVGGRKVDLELPFLAVSLTRKNLDENLLDLAERAGAEVIRGGRVERLESSPNGWEIELRDGQRVSAQHVFLATGKHDLRGHSRPDAVQNDMIAFKQYFLLSQKQTEALRCSTELYIFPGGYAGLQPVEGGLANFCLVVQRDRYKRLGSRWESLHKHIEKFSPYLRERLAGAEPTLERPLALSGIPYGYIRRRKATSVHGLWHLGDQAAVIPSLTGDGMSIALHTAHRAVEHYLRGQSPAEADTCIHRELRRQMLTAASLSLLLTTPGLPPLLAAAGAKLPRIVQMLVTATRIQTALPGKVEV